MKKSELKALIKEVLTEGIKDGTKISDKKFPNIQGTVRNYKKKPFQSAWNVSTTDDVGEDDDDELPQDNDRIEEDVTTDDGSEFIRSIHTVATNDSKISPLEKDEFGDLDEVVEAVIESLEHLRDGTNYKGWLRGANTPKEVINVCIKLIKEEWKIK